MGLNIKVILNKKEITKEISYQISSIYKQNVLNKSTLSPLDKHKISILINFASFIKNNPVEIFFKHKLLECKILPALIKSSDIEKEIIVNFNKGIIIIEKNIVCEINFLEAVRNFRELAEKNILNKFTFSYYPFSQGINLEFENDKGHTVYIDEYHNNAFELHVQCEKIDNIYSNISDQYNIFLMSSIYNGAIKNSNIYEVHGELTTNMDDEHGISYLLITPDTIKEHLNSELALKYLYNNSIYSSPNISSFEVFKKHLDSIKDYTDLIYNLFAQAVDSDVCSDKFYVYMQYKPIEKKYRNIAEGEYEIKIKNFINNEEITIPVTCLDIAYKNIHKVLISYYRFNKNLRNLFSLNEFIENIEDSLKTLLLCEY